METVKYNASVFTQAGWREVTITAKAEKISPAMLQVTEVVEIDGETPSYGMSRTGAKRQSYNGKSIAAREVGKKKRVSSCQIMD